MAAERKGDRFWTVEAPVFEEDGELAIGEVDADELARVAADVATVVRMVGGTATFAADRVPVEEGIYVTQRVIFRWHSFAPARPRPAEVERVEREQAAAEEPAELEPEPEPVAAE